MIVLDASAVVELLLGTAAGRRVKALIQDDKETLHAPDLLDVEVAQVLRRLERSRELAPDRTREAFEDFRAIAIVRYPHAPFLERVWALRQNLSAYDAAYLELAMREGLPLATRDRALARAAQAAGVGRFDPRQG